MSQHFWCNLFVFFPSRVLKSASSCSAAVDVVSQHPDHPAYAKLSGSDRAQYTSAQQASPVSHECIACELLLRCRLGCGDVYRSAGGRISLRQQYEAGICLIECSAQVRSWLLISGGSIPCSMSQGGGWLEASLGQNMDSGSLGHINMRCSEPEIYNCICEGMSS